MFILFTRFRASVVAFPVVWCATPPRTVLWIASAWALNPVVLETDDAEVRWQRLAVRRRNPTNAPQNCTAELGDEIGLRVGDEEEEFKSAFINFPNALGVTRVVINRPARLSLKGPCVEVQRDAISRKRKRDMLKH